MTRAAMKELAKSKLKNNWGVVLASLIIFYLISAAAASAFGIIQLIIAGPMSIGLCTVFLNLFRDGKAKVESLFSGFNDFFNNFLLGLLVQVFTFLWSLLFIVPGIIASYSYAMAFYIQKDNPNMKETDAINASKLLMRGHKWDLFVLDVSFFGWFLLSVLTFGILFLYVVPYHNAARTAFYLNLIGETAQPEYATDSYAHYDDYGRRPRDEDYVQKRGE